jgi:hypothetical protein
MEEHIMDKKKILNIAGIIAIAGGTAALYFSGSTEGNALNIVSGMFVIIGIIMSFLKGKK